MRFFIITAVFLSLFQFMELKAASCCSEESCLVLGQLCLKPCCSSEHVAAGDETCELCCECRSASDPVYTFASKKFFIVEVLPPEFRGAPLMGWDPMSYPPPFPPPQG